MMFTKVPFSYFDEFKYLLLKNLRDLYFNTFNTFVIDLSGFTVDLDQCMLCVESVHSKSCTLLNSGFIYCECGPMHAVHRICAQQILHIFELWFYLLWMWTNACGV